MTPLAQAIVRRGMRESQRWRWADLERSDCRCFELTAAHPLVLELACNVNWIATEGSLFLPAPATWLEWRETRSGADDHRAGILMTGIAAGAIVEIDGTKHRVPRDGFLMRYFVHPDGDVPHRVMGANPILTYAREPGGELMMAGPSVLDKDQDVFEFTAANLRMACAALALINTPRIVGRKTHLPHAGLQRDLARARKMVGKFPLQTWTEITLDLTPPKEAQDDGHEAHLTGGRALHFCRAHLRVRLGKLEYVRWHWRGDASIGIKRSRYTLKPPRPGGREAA